MRGTWVLAAALLLAGCAGSTGGGGTSSSEDFSGLGGEATETTGLIRGIVVDEAIRPIAKAELAVSGGQGTPTQATADDQGRFVVDGLAPGTYLVKATHLLYEESQTTVEVVAGVDDPPTTRLQLVAKFTSTPYSVPNKFVGFIECGFQVGGTTSLCLNDYETLVVPDIPPTLKTLLDNRGYVHAIDGGWSTLQYELEWEPSAQGTSEEMFLLTSFWNRTASDWYGQTGGVSPVILRFEVNETYPEASADSELAEEQIRPEGQDDLYTYGGIQAAEGMPVGVGIEQRFTIYQHTFYYAKPPEGWSFVAGDKPPF